jgi:hypothetical protein
MCPVGEFLRRLEFCGEKKERILFENDDNIES